MISKINSSNCPRTERQKEGCESHSNQHLSPSNRRLFALKNRRFTVNKILAAIGHAVAMAVIAPAISFAILCEKLSRQTRAPKTKQEPGCLAKTHLACQCATEKERIAKDLDKMIELAEELTADQKAYAEATQIRRDEVYRLYETAVARESHLIVQVRRNPENLELVQNLEEERWKANALYREYMAIPCHPREIFR